MEWKWDRFQDTAVAQQAGQRVRVRRCGMAPQPYLGRGVGLRLIVITSGLNFLTYKIMKVRLERGFSKPILNSHTPCDSTDRRCSNDQTTELEDRPVVAQGGGGLTCLPLWHVTRNYPHTSSHCPRPHSDVMREPLHNPWGKQGQGHETSLDNLGNLLWMRNYFQNTKFYSFKVFLRRCTGPLLFPLWTLWCEIAYLPNCIY